MLYKNIQRLMAPYLKTINKTALLLILMAAISATRCFAIQYSADTSIYVPIGGNAWQTGTDTAGGRVTNAGITRWTDQQKHFNVHVRFGRMGTVKLWLIAGVPDGSSTIVVSAAGVSKKELISGAGITERYMGEWVVKDTGYVDFEISGVNKTGNTFATITNLKLQGTAAGSKTNYVRNNDGQFFYWGRRGPSVHLNYPVADSVNAEWFYNEVTVAKGNDVIGSYFMADGFGEGYFGMQVNSPTERHILFSVWSPFQTDDPKKIPEDQKIYMLKKGADVYTGEFGNEGSGGQSFLLYNWKAGNTYRFLMHARPGSGNRTVYTAYFYAPELKKWLLIASFSRPQTHTYLKRLHSFLENFEPEAGETTRQVLFSNEWAVTEKGKWIELNKARFTGDNTAVKGYRMDYAGGVNGDAFYLKNCGFFNNYTPRNITFERPLTGRQPVIDLTNLP